MNINYNSLLERLIIKFVTIFIVLLVCVSIIYIIALRNVNTELTKLNENRLKYAYNKYGNNIEILCLITVCQSIYIRDPKHKNFITYSREENGFRPVLSEKPSSYKDMIDKYSLGDSNWYSLDNHSVVVKYPLNGPKRDNFKVLAYIGLLVLLSATLSIIIVLVDIRFNMMKQNRSKTALNDQLRFELTESLHHELAGPISVIESNINYFIKRTITCQYDSKHMCRYYLNFKEIPECSKCTYRGIDTAERLSSTLVSIESMKSILCTMSHLKKMRYQKDNLSLSVILDSVSALNRINTYNVTRITVLDKEMTDNLIVGGTLGDGVLFNSIMTLINNSNEANATQITIKPSLLKDGIMELYISDNGTGIQNSKGAIEKNPNKIFDYGYSTKDKTQTIKNTVSFIRKFFSSLFFKNDGTTTRGVGLAIAKKVLRDNGGNIELVNTSFDGTVFKITFPVTNRNV